MKVWHPLTDALTQTCWRVLSLWAVVVGSSGQSHSAPTASTKERFSTIDVKHTVGGNRAYFDGLTERNLALMTSGLRWSAPTGSVMLINPRKGVVERQLNVNGEFGWDDIHLSPDGRLIFGYQSLYTRSRVYPQKVIAFDSLTLSRLGSSNVGPHNNITGLSFHAKDADPLVLSINSEIPYGKNDFISGDDRILVINAKSKKSPRTIHHPVGGGDMLFSPNNRLMAWFYPGDEIDPGRVDIIDYKSGKLLFTVQDKAEKRRLVYNGPFFFLSTTRFVCGPRLVCDLRTRKIGPLCAGDLRCVGGVGTSQRLSYDLKYGSVQPNISLGDARQDSTKGLGRAFFATKDGLELWSITGNKMLRRWPTLNNVDYVNVSPRLTMMAVHRGPKIEFWKFDPKWLK